MTTAISRDISIISGMNLTLDTVGPVAHILLIDDDPRAVRAISTLLRKRHHQVTSVPKGGLVRRALKRGGIDIALVNIDLPDIDGLTLVHQVREEGDETPLILLTVRDDAHEQALALRLGGDDYIVKPFDPEVLLARIHAVLRRSTAPRRTESGRDDAISIPPVLVDLMARQVVRDGVVVRLAPMEYAILEFLAVNRGRAVSKEELMLQVWGTDRGVSRTLAEHISRLRRKLGENLIVTQTGYGYLIPAVPSPFATAGR